MAEDKKKRRVVKKTETVRERANKATESAPKQRRIRKTAGTINRPLKVVGRGVAAGARPFGFLLAPFRTRPMRAIGRFLSIVLFITYVRNSWRELRQVSWPSRRETTKLTVAVFVFAIVFALLIALVDFGLDKVFKALLLK